ncbi:MAG: glycoside hydrolase family 3 protein [Methyloceanibacter sp.]|uniref:glycoside hydrolase family 3 protein n=1 Tax=Methyloceanibacter sp. TaxID=1965321 RepID=UPI003D9BA22B
MKVVIAAGVLALGVLALQPRPAADGESAQEPSTGAADAQLDRMIGQMIMVGFPGDDEQDPGVIAVHDQLAKGVVGGVVLYPENIGQKGKLKALTAHLRSATSNPVPFIAVDQEGGLVQRLARRDGYTDIPSAASIAANPSYSAMDSVGRLYGTMAAELADAGFNLNFGPVVDLNLNPENPVIGARGRSFGSDPKRVTDYARAFIAAHRRANIVTAAKHFPGHGSSQTDSHESFSDISKTWRDRELEPYRVLAQEGLLDMVMVGHLYHPRFSDGSQLPASLSGRAVRSLRDPHWLAFKGVVMSDDLEMGAVEDYPIEERVIKAINAGTDLIMFSNVMSENPELGPELHAVIADAVRNGLISRTRIEQAYGKIMLLKRKLVQKDLGGKS